MNAIMPWNPLRELDSFGQRLNRLMERFPRDFQPAYSLFTPSQESEDTPGKWNPAADISETDKAYRVKVDMPEVQEKDLKVTMKNGILEITGERKSELEEKDAKHHRIERSYGRFERCFSMPEDANPNAITATYQQGVLTVTVPKTENPQAKEITVKVN